MKPIILDQSPSLLASTLLVLALSVPALSQDLELDFKLLYEIEGDSEGDYFGAGLWNVGDVNQDGLTDFLTTAFEFRRPEWFFRYARVHSGKDGRALYQLPYASRGDSSFASSINAGDFALLGDLDADGINDYIAGDYWNGHRSTVFSGRNGRVIREHDGAPVSLVGDLDGDGIKDYAVTSRVLTSPRTYSSTIYSGSSGNVLFLLETRAVHRTVQEVGDINDDGAADISITSRADVGGSSGGYQIFWISGTFRGEATLGEIPNSYILARITSGANDRSLRNSARASIDLDGDGVRELILELRDDQSGQYFRSAFSPIGPTQLWRKAGQFSPFSFSIDDLNGDGWSEILSPSSATAWRVISGKDGEALTTIDRVDGISVIEEVTLLSDLDGDGFRELVFRDKSWKQNTGRVLVYSMFGGKSEPYRPGNPQLTVHATPEEVTIAWPAAITDPQPQWSTDLQTWKPVFEGTAPESGRFVLPGTKAEPQQYFRLQYEE